MSDLFHAAGWIVALAGALWTLTALHRLGLRRTVARDLLHVGAGVWALGWPLWRSPLVPVALVALVFVATVAVPGTARRTRSLARLADSLSDDDERWAGLVHYVGAVLVLTFLALARAPIGAGPAVAAAALFALTLGDGLGGAVGRRFGRRFFRGGGKRKSFEGSLVVAIATAAGVLFASVWFGVPIGLSGAAALGIIAALAEALAPAGTDNLLVPAAVYVVARWAGILQLTGS